MKDNKKYTGEWILFQAKDNKILAHDVDFMKIFRKGQKYPANKVIIEQKLEKGSCFF